MYTIYSDYDNIKYTSLIFAFIVSSWFWYFVGMEILECALISLWFALIFVIYYRAESLLFDASCILAFASAYVYLYKGSFFRQLHKSAEAVLHISIFWIILLWIYKKLEVFGDSFILWHYQEYLNWFLYSVIFAAVILVVYIFRRKNLFPFSRCSNEYWRIGLTPVLFFLVIKLVWALFIDYKFSLQYIPILNPLEEGIIFTLIIVKFYLDKTFQDSQKRFAHHLFFAFICFLELNGVILRTLSCFLDIPWSFYYLWNSETAQSALSIMWTFLALALIIFANRNKKRDIWFVGMALLVIVTAKLVLHDSVRLEGLFRAFVFIGVALLMLIIGFLAPIPPKEDAKDKV